MTEQPVPTPPWVDAKMDQRIALLRESGVIDDPDYPIIMTFLTDPDEDSEAGTARWEQTCDKCGRANGVAYLGTTSRIVDGKQIIVSYGVCNDCADH